MRQNEHSDPDDGMHIELEDVGVPQPSRAKVPSRHGDNPFLRRTSPRRRISRLAVLLITCLLAAVLIIVNLPGARSAALGLFSRPTPTPPLPSYLDQFYMLPNPPGVSVQLDGKPLQMLPLPGLRPLRVTPGRHTFEWRPGTFPFRSVSCVLSVPRVSTDTCATAPGFSLPATSFPSGILPVDVTVIEMHESLVTLAVDQATTLTSAIQAVLDARTSTATVAVGEHYYGYASNGSGRVMVATQPLRATLRLVLRAPGVPGACALSPGAVQPCRAPGQDCSEFCTLTNPALALSATTWPAGVVVSADWTYTTLGGQVVAQHIGDPGLNANLAVMLVTWNGTQWSVTPVIGHRVSTPEADDPLCDPARNWLASGPLAGLLQAADATAGTHPTIAYASAPELTDGCVVSIAGYGQGGASPASQVALFLEHFGVLVAVNAAAARLWPGIPAADTAEVVDATALANSADISQ